MLRKLLGVLAPFFLVTACATPGEVPPSSVADTPTKHPTSILFVGNSYLYYNDSLHNHVKRMVEAAEIHEESALSFKSATIGGAALRDHNIEHLLDPENLRVDDRFEVIVMQGGSYEPLSQRGRKRFLETVKSYAAKVRSAGGTPMLYMTHAYVPPHRNHREGMIEDIASLYVEAGAQTGAEVIPVGLAFEEAYRRRPGIQLHKAFDGTHPDLLGTYLAAATVFAAIYGMSPVGLEYDYFGEVAREDALFLQQVAQDTVNDFSAQE